MPCTSIQPKSLAARAASRGRRTAPGLTWLASARTAGRSGAGRHASNPKPCVQLLTKDTSTHTLVGRNLQNINIFPTECQQIDLILGEIFCDAVA